MLHRTSHSGRAPKRSGETWVRTTWRGGTTRMPGSTCLGGRGGVRAPDAGVHPPHPASCVLLPGLPKMEASQPYSGIPPPPGALGPALRLSPGDVVEVTVAEAEQLWWQVRTGPSWSCWDGAPLWGQTTMATLGWTSSMEADHYGHTGMELQYGGRPWPHWEGPLLWEQATVAILG